MPEPERGRAVRLERRATSFHAGLLQSPIQICDQFRGSFGTKDVCIRLEKESLQAGGVEWTFGPKQVYCTFDTRMGQVPGMADEERMPRV